MDNNLILLIYPDRFSAEANSSPYVQLASYPQLGLLYLASKLRQAGFKPIYMDPAVTDVSLQSISSRVQTGNVLFVGIYSNFGLRQDACRIIRSIKKQLTVPVVIGGPGFYEAEHYFEAGADAVVGGEAEEIIVPIATAIQNGHSLHGIAGVSLAGDSGRSMIAPAPLITDLDRLPRPAWDLAPPACYKNYLGLYTRHPYYVVSASRGCPMQCAFCSTNVYKQSKSRYRLRSVDNVVNEIQDLNRKFGIRHIKFQDDNFGANQTWIVDFCKKMMAARLPVKWNCSMHPLFFRKNPEHILEMMKKAGCLSIHFGLQSTDPDILKRINRSPVEPALILKLVPMMKKMGFYTVIDFIYGLPGETRRVMRENLQFALRSGVHMIQITPLTVAPGSELYEQYGDQPVTSLTPEDVYSAIKRSNRAFFSRPKLYLETLVFVLKYNPRFFINLLHILPFFIKLVIGKFPLIRWTESKGIGYYEKRDTES